MTLASLRPLTPDLRFFTLDLKFWISDLWLRKLIYGSKIEEGTAYHLVADNNREFVTPLQTRLIKRTQRSNQDHQRTGS